MTTYSERRVPIGNGLTEPMLKDAEALVMSWVIKAPRRDPGAGSLPGGQRPLLGTTILKDGGGMPLFAERIRAALPPGHPESKPLAAEGEMVYAHGIIEEIAWLFFIMQANGVYISRLEAMLAELGVVPVTGEQLLEMLVPTAREQ